MKKWHNGKFERVIKMSDYDGDWYDVDIYARNPRGRLQLVDGMHFINRSQAVFWALKCRLARLYPGRLFDLTVSEGGDYDYV
jgi:hypothetical protein